MILKEDLTIKRRERAALGWNEVYEDLSEAPFYQERERIVKVFKEMQFLRAEMDSAPYGSKMELNTIPTYV